VKSVMYVMNLSSCRLCEPTRDMDSLNPLKVTSTGPGGKVGHGTSKGDGGRLLGIPPLNMAVSPRQHKLWVDSAAID
jgi:hypothetical protein